MKHDRILHAFGTTWDAADAVACRMRLQAIRDMTGRPDVEVDASSQERARMALRTPSGNPISYRLSDDETTMLAVCAVQSDQGHGSLAMALIGHPSMGEFVLDMPLGSATALDDRLIRSADGISSRIDDVLRAVTTTSTLLESGKLIEVVQHRLRLKRTGKSLETVMASHWTAQGSLIGPTSSIIATAECATPWTSATFTTKQAIAGLQARGLATNRIDQRNARRSLLDEEGIAILHEALPLALDVEWIPNSKTPDGSIERRMRINPASMTTMISSRSLLDTMETLRCHRTIPIPERCVTKIGS